MSRIVGNYLLSHEIGRGGEGIVYFGTNQKTGEEAALKIMHVRQGQ